MMMLKMMVRIFGILLVYQIFNFGAFLESLRECHGQYPRYVELSYFFRASFPETEMGQYAVNVLVNNNP